tara:strand:- start:487 stop:996 length:510 start_codon:yes stop_codon:yes gene_type:complete
MNSVDTRKESSAEHSWGCLMLADFFLSQMNDHKLDKLKVYELLMYHDVVEIEAGDTPLHPEMSEIDDKEKREKLAAEFLEKELPSPINTKFKKLFVEFEAQETREAKFAKAIDCLEIEFHCLDYKYDWKGWTKEFLIKKKAKYFEDFPLLKKIFYEYLEYATENGYFNQ